MNFFFDEEEDTKKETQAKTSPVVGNSPKRPNLIDIGEDETSIDVPKQPDPLPPQPPIKVQQNLIPLDEEE